MLPRELKPENFGSYPPQARKLVLEHLTVLQQLPLSFLPSLLREAIDYDYRFPAERDALDREFTKLSSLSEAERQTWFQGFNQFTLSPKLEQSNWVIEPAQFVEQLSAHLWTTHQLDAFRNAATEYGTRLQSITQPQLQPIRRLGIAVIGKDVPTWEEPLFRRLRTHGTYFGKINPEDGLAHLIEAAETRATAHPTSYAHWYIDGGQPADHSANLTVVSYRGTEPIRASLLRTIQNEVQRPGMGPEELRSRMAQLTPTQLGISATEDEVLSRFQVRLLTEGSGTQIFATTFAQWATREVLRRAQAQTLLVRYAPRQRQRPMNELLSASHPEGELDPAGSLVDAEMAAYYHWINQQRLPGAEQSAFLIWFEGHNQALAIGPTLPRGVESSSVMNLKDLVTLALS